jgi:hypothetical protein
MNYRRLALLATSGAIGLGGRIAIMAADNSPRWLIAAGGILGLAGVTATFAIGLIAWVLIAENLTVRFRIGKPENSLSLSQNEPALIGNVRLRQYAVGRWGVVVINNRFLFGFMTLGSPEYHSFKKDGAA